MTALGEYFPQGVNMHVTSMQYAADVELNGPLEVEIPAMDTADADCILDGQSIASATSTQTFNVLYVGTEAQMGKFGRTLQYVASGAATSTVTVTGYDYLGQLMVETITLNGATAVQGKKAFRRIETVAWTATAATTIDVGTSVKSGLPYKALGALFELVDKAVPGTAGTLTVGVDTQTATSDDPRGLYAPHSSVVMNGSRVYLVGYRPDRENLHGAAHYNG